MPLKERNCEHPEKLNLSGMHSRKCAELRTCTMYMITHCFDSSPNQYVIKHFESVWHPVVSSSKPKERSAYDIFTRRSGYTLPELYFAN
jgi:hypothetical protein